MNPERLDPTMSLWEISFRVQYDYPFIAISGRYPGVPISMWCIWNRELIQVPTRNRDILEGIERDVRKAGRIVEKWEDAEDSRVFMLRCTCGNLDSHWNVVDGLECIEVPPAIYRDGWGYLRVLSFDESQTRDMFREFSKRGAAELIKKRELPLTVLPTSIWVNSLFGELTGKQMDALLKAHRYGYYSSPREITTENVSKSLGISRSTYEEHLRKAENRIMNALVPYLQIFTAADRVPEREPEKSTVVGHTKASAKA
jgi:hypothetical protein